MKVSIITAVYNRVSTVEDAIRSVLSQDYPDIEYIVIDGASKDGTLEVINKYRDRISVVVSEKDKGIYDALNKGIARATGDVIGFLHSDDLFSSPHVITSLMNTMESTGADSAYGNLEYVQASQPDNVVRFWNSGAFQYSSIKRGWTPPHPAFYIRRSVYLRYGMFDTSFAIASDYDITLRFLYKNKITTAYVNQTIVKMRVGGASNTPRNIYQKMKEDARAMKRNGLCILYTLPAKNIRKLPQFFKRKQSF